ncbi:MAG: hypothetical protein AAFV53_29425 [Myxococcota bacterium]
MLFASMFMFTVLSAPPASAGDYTLTIDGSDFDLDLNAPQQLRLPDGSTIQVTLSQKAVVSFSSESFSFAHPSHLSPARTDLGQGIYQTMMATPLGTLIMVQEYTTLDPSSLVDLMLSELTKEERQYGYTINETLHSRTLKGGQVLSGKRAVSNYRGVGYTREIVSFGTRDAGLMVITQTSQESSPEDLAMIEAFWESMAVSLR